MVTLRVRDDVENLRRMSSFRVITRAFEAWTERDGFRLLHFAVMGNHLHLVAEADSTRALSRAMQGIAIRIAKGLNRVMNRQRGPVFAGRYHNHVLQTRREVRNALAYVLCNARKHPIAKNVKRTWVDPWSSAHAFGGWLGEWSCKPKRPIPVATPQSIIARQWRMGAGGIPPDTVPGRRSEVVE